MSTAAMIANSVQDAYLLFVSDNRRLPIGTYMVHYELDSMPTCTLVPAIGQPFKPNGKAFDLRTIKLNDRVELWLRFNGIDRLQFSGYIQSGAPQVVSSPTASSMGLGISLSHITGIAAGFPPVSYVYSRVAESLQALTNMKQPVTMFGHDAVSGAPAVATAQALAAVRRTLGVNSNDELSMRPAQMIAMIVQALLQNFQSGQLTEARAGKNVPVNLPGIFRSCPGIFPQAVPAIATEIVEVWRQTWGNSNCWESMLRSAQHMLLHLVPFSTGVYVANTFALYNKPAISLGQDAYTTFDSVLSSPGLQPIDGVAMRSPISGSEVHSAYYYTWPDTGNDSAFIRAGKWYHIRDIPAWATNWASSAWSPLPGSVGDKTNSLHSTVPDAATIAAQQLRIGNSLAKVVCGEMKDQHKEGRLILPYREDLMPGTLVQIDARGSNLTFLGDILYAMVSAVTVQCSNLNNEPDLHLEVRLNMIRNSASNADTNLTLPSHPLYDKIWPGTKLDGTLLT